MEKFGGYKTEVAERIEKKETVALEEKVEGRKHLYGRLRDEIMMETYSYGPTDYAKMLKLYFRVGDLNLSERKKRYTNSREKRRKMHRWALWRCTDGPCGKAKESRTHIVGECEMYKEERDVLEMRKNRRMLT